MPEDVAILGTRSAQTSVAYELHERVRMRNGLRPVADGCFAIVLRWARRVRQARSWWRALLVFLVILLLCVLVNVESALLASPGDFLSYYGAALAAKENLDVYDPGAVQTALSHAGISAAAYPYLYPPFLASLLRLLSGLTLRNAQLVWIAGNLVAITLTITICLSLCPRTAFPLSRSGRASSAGLVQVLLAALLLWVLPFRNNVGLGQVNPLVLMFLVLALRAHLQGRDGTAGAWLAPAVLIKITPVLLVFYFVARRSVRAVVAHVAAVSALALGTVALGGGAQWWEFLKRLPERSYGKSIPGLFAASDMVNIAPAGLFSRLLPVRTAIVQTCSAAVILVLLSIACALAYRARETAQRRLALALFFPLVMLASPYAYLHHIVYVLPALVIWFEAAWQTRHRAVFVVLLGATFVASTDWPLLYDDIFPKRIPALVSGTNLYALLVMAGLGVFLAVRSIVDADYPCTEAPGLREASVPVEPSPRLGDTERNRLPRLARGTASG